MKRVMCNALILMLLVPMLAYAAEPRPQKPAVRPAAASFRFQKLTDRVYAAVAVPGGNAASNSLIIVTDDQVVLAGAHFTADTTRELLAFIRAVTPLPVHNIILTHHHRGYNHIDFDLPGYADLIMSGETWQALKSEFRQIRNQVTFFDRGATMKRGSTLIIMNNTVQGHADGDVVVYLPEEKVLFTSDLFFNDVSGYMGDGHFREWIEILEMLTGIDARYVVPGLGEVTNSDGIRRFQDFFRDFTTEVLRVAEPGVMLETAKRKFSLPQYERMPGYRAFFDANFKRAFSELKELKELK